MILTAYSDESARQRAMQAGAMAFLDKPFVSAELIAAVRSGPRCVVAEGEISGVDND